MDISILAGLHSEDYDDQDGRGFKYLSYPTPTGETIVDNVKENIFAQVHEIRRTCGKDTPITLYKEG